MKITRIETVHPADIMPGLLAVRIHTDENIVGGGETYYAPSAPAALIHDWMARYLLGKDPLDVERHWRFLHDRASAFGGRSGGELRALSAIDLALWDILGQRFGQPIWRFLGGRTQDLIPVYNTSAGPTYMETDARYEVWPGYGTMGRQGPLNDYWAYMNEPEKYVREVLGLGYRAIKVFPFDSAAHKPGGGMVLSAEDLEKGMEPLRRMREAAGDRIEIILDGHGFFTVPVGMRIAQALREIRPLWVEDLIRVDCVAALADFRKQAGVPLAVSEMIVQQDDFRSVLESHAADYLMIDPTWSGGISQARRMVQWAQSWNIPAAMHDCTGPFALMAGIHIGIATGAVAWQETVRAHLQLVYPALIKGRIPVLEGKATAPEEAGMGIRWQEGLFEEGKSDYRVSAAT